VDAGIGEFEGVNADRLDQLPGWRSPYVVAILLTLIGFAAFVWILVEG